MKPFHLVALTLSLAGSVLADDALPKTLLTTRGKLLYSEDFAATPPPLTGKPVGFASGFSGWRYNVSPKGGHWEVVDGTFKGAENPEVHHPATASYGLPFKDAVVQCEIRLDDVPEEGRKNRYAQVKATDEKDYVCALSLAGGGLTGVPYDANQINPTTKQRMTGPQTRVATPIKLGEWHTLVLEIKGEEVVGSVDGKSVTFANPLIGSDKHSIMLVAGTQASFRKLRIWEALPNPDWAKNKEAVAAQAAAPAKAPPAK
jgi:hypothetical protein